MGDELRVHVAEDGADAERVDELARHLRDELLQLDIDDVRPLSAGESPAGSRALDVVAVGGLLVMLGRSAGGLTAIVSAISKWLTRGNEPTRKIRLEVDGDTLELSSVTATEQEQLISLFVGRHAMGEGVAWPGSE